MTETPSSPAFDPAGTACALLHKSLSGALATLEAATGAPFVSLVTYALNLHQEPVFLLSKLSAHTTNILHDSRISLLLVQTGKGDPLAHPRVTLMGQAVPTLLEDVRDIFLKRHPKARLYIDFPDFSFWTMKLEGAHVNGGFAKAARLSREDLQKNILPTA
jgi:heme iron utilization protein